MDFPVVDPVHQTEGEPRATEAIATQAVTTEPTTNDIETTAGPSGTEDAAAGHEHDDDAASVASSALTENWKHSFDEDLSDALAGIQTQGTFASFHPLKRVDPDLSVQDVGAVSLPLSESTVRQLIDKAIRAPFGKGSETIVDTAVRNTWELDPSQFKLRSPRWAADLQKICAVVAKDLGVTLPGYRVVLTYNLAVDPAASRPSAGLRRQETRGLRHTLRRWLKDPDAGEIDHVYYGLGHEYTEANISMNALKGRDAAIVQTLQELSAGLEFDVLLALTEKKEIGPTKYAGNPQKKVKKTRRKRKQTKRWSEAELREGADLFDMRVEDFESSSDGFDSDPNEAQMSHETEVPTYKSLSVKVVVDLSGSPILRDVGLDWNNVLDAMEFFGGAERHEKYEGYQGNWGPTATHWYCTTAVLIIRRDKISSFLKGRMTDKWDPDENHSVLLDYLTDSVLKALQNRKSSYETLKDIWGTSILRPETRAHTLSRMLRSAVALKDFEFFEKVSESRIDKEGERPLPASYYQLLYDKVSDGEVAFSHIKKGYVFYAVLCPMLPTFVLINHVTVVSSLTSTVLKGRQFFEICETVWAFAPPDQPLSDEIREWARATLTKGLKDIADAAIFIRQDGLALVMCAERYADFEWLSSVVMPLIEELLVSTPAFALEFLSALLSGARRKAFPVTQAVNLYKRLARDLISMLDLEKVHGPRGDDPAHRAARNTYGRTAPHAPDHRLALTHVAVADLFSGLIKLASSPPQEDLVLPLVLKIVSHAPKMQPLDFPVLWIPLLRELLAILEATKTPLDTPRYQQLFAAVFEAYRDNYVGSKPVRPPSGQLGSGMYLVQFCTCGDCSKLDNFLANPSQTSLRLIIGTKKQRHHVRRVIYDHGIQVTHETERFAPGGPTMVITKMGQMDVAKQQARAKEAEAVFQAFDQTNLGVLLGEDYPAIATVLWQRPVNLVPGRGGVRYPPAPVAAPVVAAVPPPVPAPGPAAADYVPLGHTIVAAVGPAWIPPPTNRHQPMIGSERGPPPEDLEYNTTVEDYWRARNPRSRSGPQPMNGPVQTPTEMQSAPRPFAPTTGNAGGPLRPPPSVANGMGLDAVPGPSRAPPPIAGTKRKAEPEIIDLT
ncbi:hypothetical protein BDP55DRAFT_762977 [Colletotrichum godetiae]|uniref:Uncharacterized protein n=1 Tax=Colletotrichum godetiae TaxID=1209918 RepID=A0AAJ0AZX4_9PEZI|nr:uncharacterized protein BDP55DRAFT_762977 [Colletotrichum godetiae]KAK1701397.1 hypothetical protein BDP55DRAFT_762977 [Colletotrichum godetiae]